MDIKHIPGQASQQQIESGKAHKTTDTSQGKQTPKNQSVVVPSEDRVEISGLAEKLKSTLATLDSVADVNIDKVTTIKNAIDSGSYQINSANISEKLINFELSFPE